MLLPVTMSLTCRGPGAYTQSPRFGREGPKYTANAKRGGLAGKPRVPVLSSGSRDFVIRNSKGSRNQSTHQFAVRVPRIGVVGGGSCEETATQLCASFGLASGRDVRSHSRHIRCSHVVILRQSWDSNRWAIFVFDPDWASGLHTSSESRMLGHLLFWHLIA